MAFNFEKLSIEYVIQTLCFIIAFFSLSFQQLLAMGSVEAHYSKLRRDDESVIIGRMSQAIFGTPTYWYKHRLSRSYFYTCKLFGNVVSITFQNAAKILGLIISAALFALMRNLISVPYLQ